MQNVLQPLTKSVLIPLVLTVVTFATDVGIHKSILGLRTTTLILSNWEMDNIMKIVKSLEDACFQIHSFTN